MYYVYILKNEDGKLYKGVTSDLKKRLVTHNSGGSKHTASRAPWKIIFYCAFPDEIKALTFEKYLKTASGIAFSRKRLI